MLRQFFLTLPQELVDAAEIDGASPPRIYFSLFLPLCKPALATLAVLFFMGRWNDLLGAVVCLRKREMWLAGLASAQTRRELERRGWVVREAFRRDLLDPVSPVD